jgi:uncharacterized protein (TIGR02646 family)
MVFIDKSNVEIPAILIEKGQELTSQDLIDYDNDRLAFRRGIKEARKFSFDRSVYAHKTVKSSLEEIQNYKCCFCESKYKHVAFGDVEHFRPKAYVMYAEAEANLSVLPGYFWLAYDWSNLLVSCEICNRTMKKNYFPLSDPSERCDPDGRDISAEEPIFINPSLVDPQEHIEFKLNIPRGKSDSGKTTIEYLGLDRNELNEIRWTQLDLLLSLEYAFKVISDDNEEKETVRNHLFKQLREPICENGQYSLMIKQNFKEYIELI